MKLKIEPQRVRGLTMIEVLVMLALVVLLAVVLRGLLASPRTPARRIQCASQLRNCGLALRLWADDHGGKFPAQVSTNHGGSSEYTNSKDTFRHFLAIGSEGADCKQLVCPMDQDRVRADSFSKLNNRNVSYFLALNSDHSNTSSVLAGDRNIAAKGQNYANGNYLIPTNQILAWGEGLHHPGGNIVFADGHVEQCDSRKLAMRMSNTGQPTNWLAFP